MNRLGSRYRVGVATFMAYAAADLRPEAPTDAFVAALERELVNEETADQPLAVWVTEIGERARVTLYAAWGNIWLGNVLVRAATDVDRAVLGLDHDEYGVAHVVFDGRGGSLLRIHHVNVYPGGEIIEEYAPILRNLPARTDIVANRDGTMTGADALAAAAALYDVSAADMVRAVRETADAHQYLQIVFTPLAPWWEALGLAYPVPDLGEPTTVLQKTHGHR